MAETNGGGRLDDARLSKLEAAMLEVNDALIVMAHLETKAAARVKEHAQFIGEHDSRIAQQDKHSAELDARVDKLVSAIGELIARIPPSSLAS
jgi:hypothetical protein